MQTRELRDYCERRGWIVSEYVDTGISDAKDRRPELERLMADVHKQRSEVKRPPAQKFRNRTAVQTPD